MNFDESLTLIVSVEYKSFSAGVELSSLDLYSWFVANRKSDVVVVVVDVVDVVRSENVLFRRNHFKNYVRNPGIFLCPSSSSKSRESYEMETVPGKTLIINRILSDLQTPPSPTATSSATIPGVGEIK